VSLQEIVDELAGRLDRPVTASSPALRPLAYSAQPAGVDRVRMLSILERRPPPGIAEWVQRLHLEAVTGPVRTDGVQELGLTERIVVPIRVQGVVRGYLWIIDPGHRLGDETLEAISSAGDAAAALIEREDAARRSGRDHERELLRELLAGEDAGVVRELRERATLFSASAFAAVVVRAKRQDGEDEAAAPLLSVAPPPGVPMSAFVELDDVWTGVAPLHAVEGGADALLEDLTRKARTAVVIGVGGATPLGSVRDSHQQAIVAADVAACVPECGPIARWDALGVYRVVWQLERDGVALETLHASLPALLEAPGRLDLPRTLEAFLDRGGETQATAAALYLHRTTLYHRLQRIEELTGASLSSGHDRTLLHLALKLARYRGALDYPSVAVADEQRLSDAS